MQRKTLGKYGKTGRRFTYETDLKTFGNDVIKFESFLMP